MESNLYYECHITVEPLFEQRLSEFEAMCRVWQFRVAKLLMQRRASDTPHRSANDAFCTGRDKDYARMTHRMLGLIRDLKTAGFAVWRLKIEDTVLDSKVADIYTVLSPKEAA